MNLQKKSNHAPSLCLPIASPAILSLVTIKRLAVKSQSVFPIPETSDDWIKNELHKKFPPDEAEKMYRRVTARYEKFMRDAPTIGGKANPMVKNFYGVLSAFAYYECMKRAMPPEDITAMCYGMMPGDKKSG